MSEKKEIIKDIITLLRVAMSLEALTIPPYMTAYWSIKKSPNTDANEKAKEIIHSVAMEEMLHMMSVGNIIASLDYCPLFYHKSNTLEKWGQDKLPILGIPIDLTPFSIEQVEKFLEIEKPVKPIDIKLASEDNFPRTNFQENEEEIKTLEDDLENTSDIDLKLNRIKEEVFIPNGELNIISEELENKVKACKTIGEFYTLLISELKKLEDEDFGKKGLSQLDLSYDPRIGGIDQRTIPSFVVDNKLKAIKLLQWVVDQGEGNQGNDDNPQDEDGELAHYYRFLQITKGMEIVKNEQSGVFEFDPSKSFVVDKNNVYKFTNNQSIYDLISIDTLANFDDNYFKMFKELQSFYLTGERRFVMQSFDYMVKLTSDANRLMELGVCPTFQFKESIK